jgi:hypothetical protein
MNALSQTDCAAICVFYIPRHPLIKMGAPDPQDGSAATSARVIDIEQGRKFWAFQPPR